MKSYCLRIKETLLQIPNLQKKYRFLHITDTHLLLYDETETKQRAEYADPRYRYFTFDDLKPHERLQVISQYIDDHSDPELPDALDGVLLMQHVPLYIPSLHEDTFSYWKEDTNIGGDGNCKNENWKKITDLILAEDSPVKALITGHLHFNHEDLLGDKIPQYVTGTATEGHVRLFVIEGER